MDPVSSTLPLPWPSCWPPSTLQVSPGYFIYSDWDRFFYGRSKQPRLSPDALLNLEAASKVLINQMYWDYLF